MQKSIIRSEYKNRNKWHQHFKPFFTWPSLKFISSLFSALLFFGCFCVAISSPESDAKFHWSIVLKVWWWMGGSVSLPLSHSLGNKRRVFTEVCYIRALSSPIARTRHKLRQIFVHPPKTTMTRSSSTPIHCAFPPIDGYKRGALSENYAHCFFSL